MYISKISIVNYRNFRSANVLLKPGVNTIIGENGSGKSNIFRAIRVLLDETFVTRKHDMQEEDFHRGLPDWRGHWIAITLEFGDVSDDESVQSLLLQRIAEESSGSTPRATYSLIFRPNSSIRDRLARLSPGDRTSLHALQEQIGIEDYERVLLGKTSVDLTDSAQYRRVVGDFEEVIFPADETGNSPSFDAELGIRVTRDMSLWREFSLSYIPALRNVVADFSDVRRNPLRTLLAAKSEEIVEGDFDAILDKVRALNSDIEDRDDVKNITAGIHKTFKDTIGETYSPTTMKIQSELPLDAADLFKSLKLYVGENGDPSPRRLHEMSLGGANLIFLTLKLLEFEYRSARQAIANFLLIEEPEAHIHTHVQKTLFDRVNYSNTQIIYTTHSTHISEVSEIERVNVLSREGDSWSALQPAANLLNTESVAAQRFLDAVRSNLLFARSVLLVEGDAEEILIPSLVRKIYGISLDEIGVSLVNIRSTGFETLARLFHEDRLRKQCAIITDHDQTFFDTAVIKSDSDADKTRKSRAAASAKSGSERKARLDSFANGNRYLHVSYAPHTFEVDFAETSDANRELLAAVVDLVYKKPTTREAAKLALESGSLEMCGRAALQLAKYAKKGWFALLVSANLEKADQKGGPVLPDYILDAIGFAAANLPRETWVRVLKHRRSAWGLDTGCAVADQAVFEEILQRLDQNTVTVELAITEISELNYNDARITSLAKAFQIRQIP
ncbi:AAA family ATPase [Pseudoclavibacter helvolus]|uniref:AAA family ATPase n=1 Tax=Pseudoclavibacter helvolus TaxID=255205 RepID=UPI003735A1E9